MFTRIRFRQSLKLWLDILMITDMLENSQKTLTKISTSTPSTALNSQRLFKEMRKMFLPLTKNSGKRSKVQLTMSQPWKRCQLKLFCTWSNRSLFANQVTNTLVKEETRLIWSTWRYFSNGSTSLLSLNYTIALRSRLLSKMWTRRSTRDTVIDFRNLSLSKNSRKRWFKDCLRLQISQAKSYKKTNEWEIK